MRICSLPQNQGSCSVDLGTGSALLNVDALGLHLDLVSGDACVSRNVTSHVCTGSELLKHRKRDTLVVIENRVTQVVCYYISLFKAWCLLQTFKGLQLRN